MDAVLRRALAMVACDWGVKIGPMGGEPPCPAQAYQRTALYLEGEAQLVVKLCPKHDEMLPGFTTPRARGGDGA